jgi:hypothetical protein
MAQAAIPQQAVQYVSVGYANVTNPILFLKVNGITYGNGYRVNYGGAGYRNFFASYDESTGEIRLYCQAVTYGADLPAEILYNIEVYLAS